jgi:hypothetical protein
MGASGLEVFDETPGATGSRSARLGTLTEVRIDPLGLVVFAHGSASGRLSPRNG